MNNYVFKLITACWSADASQRSADKSARRVVQWSRLVCCRLCILPVDILLMLMDIWIQFYFLLVVDQGNAMLSVRRKVVY